MERGTKGGIMTIAATSRMAVSSATLGFGEAVTTLYVGDTHMKDVGQQTLFTNSSVGKILHPAYHPLLATLTRGLLLDELLAREAEQSQHLSLQGMGDYTDTPSDMEADHAVTIFERSRIP